MAALARTHPNANFNNEGLGVISVKEARKLLGKDGQELSDDQIKNLIITLTEASSLLLNQNVVPIISAG